MLYLDLEHFLARAVDYKAWRAPIAPGLRAMGALAAAVYGLAIVALWGLEAGLGLLEHPFWLVLPTAVPDALWRLLAWRRALAALAACGLLALGLLALRTAGLRRGAILWHWLALAAALPATPAGLALSALAALLLLNLAIWALAALAALALALCLGALLFGRRG